MSWDIDNEQGNESAKVRYDVVPYMRGLCLDLGCGPCKVFPHFTGIDSGKDTQLFGIQMKPNIVGDVTKLERFASGSHDCVFSAHTLEHIEDYKPALKEWWRVVKHGGYMILYLPHKDFYPNCTNRDKWDDWYENHKDEYTNAGAALDAFISERKAKGITSIGALYEGTPVANKDHKHDFVPQDIIDAMKSLGGGFDVIECEERNEGDEYSFMIVLQKTSSGVKKNWRSPRSEEPTSKLQ